MLYRRQTKNLRNFLSRRNVIVAVFAVIVLFFIFDKPVSLIQIFQSTALSIYSAKETAINSIGNIFSLVISKRDLINENQSLKKQNEILNSDYNASMESLRQANLELRNSLGRVNVATKNRIGSAFVIGKPPIVPYGTIAVDLGLNQGVGVGDIALAGDYIIGKVSAVSPNRSTVKLYGGKDEKLSLFVGEKRLPLDGQGAGLGAFRSVIANGSGNDFINQNVRLVEYPDYIFGSVIEADPSEKDQDESLFIQSPVNIFELRIIDIIRNENSK